MLTFLEQDKAEAKVLVPDAGCDLPAAPGACLVVFFSFRSNLPHVCDPYGGDSLSLIYDVRS
jgi:hypothetical protein